MQANYTQRLRMVFSKTGATRYIGHLDLARTLERALNRARIPVAYTQGYSRRPRLQLAAALPLGFTSDCELADVWLLEELDPETARSQMNAKMAPGIVVHSVSEVPLISSALQMLTREATYEVVLVDTIGEKALKSRLESLDAAKTLLLERRGKHYDLRPLILEISHRGSTDGQIRLKMRLRLEQGRNGRPDEVLRALELDPLAARIHRTAILLAKESEVT